MNEDRAFVASLLAAPDDSAPWLVYADWLDERGDPRGEYIRLVQSLAVKSDPAARKRLNAVRPTLPRDWLAVVEQPKLLRANPTPYETGWSGVGLGDVRPTDATYAGDDYRTLPAVPLDSVIQFDWWATQHTATPTRKSGGRDIERLVQAARKRTLALPDAFVKFFRAGRHRGFAQSPTGCTFRLLSRLAPAPGDGDARLVRFYADSQGCLYWYLYLASDGNSCVVASTGDRHGWPGNETDCWFCAPSFEEFIVPMWLENVAWFSLHPTYAGENERRWATAPEVRAYLDHYQP